MNVLFATDGSASAQRAQGLIAATDWGAPTRIEVLHVDQLFPEDLELPPGTYSAVHEKLAQEIDALLAQTKRALEGPGREVETKVMIGRPASAMVDEARRTETDLIVLGSHGRGAIGSALVGSVVAEVIDHAPCRVLIARKATLARAVLGHDGSDGARQAEQLVTAWPFLKRMAIRVVSAWSLVPGYAALDPAGGVFLDAELYQQVIDDLRADRERAAREAVTRLAQAGVSGEAETREGSSADALVDAAKEWNADLIIVGSRGETGLARLFLGSVARSVLFHAPCSVLITRQRVSR